MMITNLRYLLLLGLLFTSCAHMRETCDSYCMRRGGVCSYVNQGWSKYNTVTGDTEERPTEFVCRYNW